MHVGSKMNARSLQHVSRNQTKNQTNCALNKSRTMDPIRTSRGVQRTSCSLPKFDLGPIGRPREPSNRRRAQKYRFYEKGCKRGGQIGGCIGPFASLQKTQKQGKTKKDTCFFRRCFRKTVLSYGLCRVSYF